MTFQLKIILPTGVLAVLLPMLWFVYPLISCDEKSTTPTRIDSVVFATACNSDGSTCIDNVLLIRGQILESTKSALNVFVDEQKIKRNQIVCFDSPGGEVDRAIALGNWIYANGMDTCYAEKYVLKDGIVIKNTICNSACPFVFLMGHKRSLVGRRATFKIHHSGRTLPLCGCKLEVNDYLYSWGRYESMLLVGRNTDDQHLDLFDLSLETHFSKTYLLQVNDFHKYGVFTEFIN